MIEIGRVSPTVMLVKLVNFLGGDLVVVLPIRLNSNLKLYIWMSASFHIHHVKVSSTLFLS